MIIDLTLSASLLIPADEPTANLDTENTKTISTLFLSLVERHGQDRDHDESRSESRRAVQEGLQHAGWEFCLISLFAMADEQQISEPARILLMNSLGFVLGLVSQFSRRAKLTETDKSTYDHR